MKNEVRAVLVEYIFDAACGEKEMDFASIILLRQVSWYFRDNLTNHRLSQKAMKQGGRALLIMYTLLKPSHSHRTISWIREWCQQQSSPRSRWWDTVLWETTPRCVQHASYQQQYPPLCMILLILNREIYIFQELGETYNFRPLEHMMNLIISYYPSNFPIMSEIITFFLRLKAQYHVYHTLHTLFRHGINRCLEREYFHMQQKENLLVNLLRGMCHSSSSNIMIQFKTNVTPISIDTQENLDTLLLQAVSVGWYKMTRMLLEMGVSPDMCNTEGFSILMLLARQGNAELYALARGKLPTNSQYGEPYHRRRGRLCKNVLHYAVNPNYRIYLRDGVDIPSHVIPCRQFARFIMEGCHDTARVIIKEGQLDPGNMTFTKEEERYLKKILANLQ